MTKNIFRTARLVCSGFCMGSADIVPGVSGGTIAFMLGIYEELIASIKSFVEPAFWHAVLRFDFPGAWKAINGNFLLAVGGGIVLAILSLSHSIAWLIEEHPVYLWAFFFGLVLASVWIVGHRIKVWNTHRYALCALGILLGYIIVGVVPVETPETWWFVVLSGAITICAMILPGISGSFLLVILGKYTYILNAVNQRDIATIAQFMGGAAIGITAFSEVLGWLFRKYHDHTIAVLTGLMLGSLRRIWPWKVEGAGELLLRDNAFPTFVMDDWKIVGAMILGIGVVWVIEKVVEEVK